MWSFILLIAIALGGCANSTPSLLDLPLRKASECGDDATEHLGSVDVAIAIDASRSTRFPSAADIDGDGEIGRVYQTVVTDREDSLLAAQVAAVRSLVRAATPLGSRFSIVTYAGQTGNMSVQRTHHVARRHAVIQSDLTADPVELEIALARVLADGSAGGSDFAAGMRRALETLEETPPERTGTRRFILFLSNSTYPVLPQPYPLVRFPEKDHLIKVLAIRAIRAGIWIDTFGLGEAVDKPTPNTLTRIAGATGGVYTGVRDAGRLHCDLLAALARTSK